MFHTLIRSVAIGVIAAGAILSGVLDASGIASASPQPGDGDDGAMIIYGRPDPASAPRGALGSPEELPGLRTPQAPVAAPDQGG
jgi:hypothetical protein